MTNRRLRQSVERGFEVIDDVARRLRDELPEIAEDLTAAAKIVGTRNAIAHGYDAVDHRRLWEAIAENLPLLMDEVTREMKALES